MYPFAEEALAPMFSYYTVQVDCCSFLEATEILFCKKKIFKSLIYVNAAQLGKDSLFYF